MASLAAQGARPAAADARAFVGHRRAGHWRQAHSARIVAALHGGGRRRNSTASPTNCGRRGAGCDCGNRCSSSRRWASRRGPCWLHLMPTLNADCNAQVSLSGRCARISGETSPSHYQRRKTYGDPLQRRAAISRCWKTFI